VPDGPLAGRTVVVTRAGEQAGPLVEQLRARGATVIEVPLVRIEPVDATPPHGPFDWLLLASANAAQAARRLGVAEAARSVGVVGPATAQAWGAPAALVAHPATAEALVGALPHGTGRVLVVQGDRARPTLVDGARAAGWTVEVVVGYRTVTVHPDATGAAALGSADAVTVASPSALDGCRDAGIRPGGVVVAIGPTTADAVRALGWGEPVVASPHTAAGLVEAVTRALGTAQGSGARPGA
jgi:uroporphyrinogen-III synthase